MADFWIELKKVPLAELAPLAELPGVAEIRPRIQFFATVDLDGVTKPLNGLVLSLPDRREPVDQRHRAPARRLLHRPPRERSDRQRGLRPAPRARSRATGSTWC